MHRAQEARPRARSPFVAAVLSLLFPGLGHAYAGAPQRALGFAAAPVLLIALGLGILLRLDSGDLLGLVLTPWVLTSVFVVNLAALVYRFVAIVDAWRVTTYLNAFKASGGGRAGRPRIPVQPLSMAGLLAVVLVMAGGHVVVARYDLDAINLLSSECIFIGSGSDEECEPTASPSGSLDPTDPPDPSASSEPSVT